MKEKSGMFTNITEAINFILLWICIGVGIGFAVYGLYITCAWIITKYV